MCDLMKMAEDLGLAIKESNEFINPDNPIMQSKLTVPEEIPK